MSAIIPEDGEAGDFEPVKVLFTLHQGLDALDFFGPLEILTYARHNMKDSGKHYPYKSSGMKLAITHTTPPTMQLICPNEARERPR